VTFDVKPALAGFFMCKIFSIRGFSLFRLFSREILLTFALYYTEFPQLSPDRTMRIFHSVCGALLACVFLACNAPRDNPLDPDADNYIGPYGLNGTISGTVESLAGLHVSGALVLTIPGYRGALTGADGSYLIEDVEPGDYQVVCAPDGFEPDTLMVSVTPKASVGANFRLDALPVVQSFQVTSQFIHQTGIPPDFYTIYAKSLVTDPDGVGDVEQVTFHIEDYLDTLMSYNPDSSVGSSFFYSLFLEEHNFPYGTVDSIKWKHFSCIVEDTSGNKASSDTLTIIRYFDDYPITISPTGYEVISTPDVQLVWESFNAFFFFTYDVRVYQRVSGTIYSLFWQSSGISSADTSIIVNEDFTNEFYYWELWVIDEYQNSARSAEAHFQYSL
jgi:hypothetical protein